jgi:DMSO/TMAO reductase YedYZ molybdopterin-dependent catalytic subunit
VELLSIVIQQYFDKDCLPFNPSLTIYSSYNLDMKKIIIGVITLLMVASCVSLPIQTVPAISTVSPKITQTSKPSITSLPSLNQPTTDFANCTPSPYLVPTIPEKIPKWNELDESIGLHVTGKYQVIDPASYRLNVSGKVAIPLEFTYDQIRCLPRETASPRLICQGVFVDYASWMGVPLKTILDLADVQEGAEELVLVSADGYQTTVSLKDALEQNSFLAYEVNGQVLPILHGFPIRAVFPEMPGANWVKWLIEIQVK